jgi:hypothetical protein
MADLHKFTVQESLNANLGQSGNFNILDASSGGLGGSAGASIAAGSNADVTNTKHLDISSGTHQLLIWADGDIYFNFATSDLDVDTDTSLKLSGEALTSLSVPYGLMSKAGGETIRFNFLSTSTTTHTVRIVEV